MASGWTVDDGAVVSGLIVNLRVVGEAEVSISMAVACLQVATAARVGVAVMSKQVAVSAAVVGMMVSEREAAVISVVMVTGNEHMVGHWLTSGHTLTSSHSVGNSSRLTGELQLTSCGTAGKGRTVGQGAVSSHGQTVGEQMAANGLVAGKWTAAASKGAAIGR
uniref:Uncharacterized protein n=1 Tax=Plectus sambesii TaxID=2011161 RepID=A0A914XFZ9_9BILA